MSAVPPQPADYRHSARSFLNDDVGMAKDRGIIKAKFQGAWILYAYIFTFQQTENVRVSKPSCKPNFTYPSNLAVNPTSLILPTHNPTLLILPP